MKLVPKAIDPRVQAGIPADRFDALTWAVFHAIDGETSIPDIAAKLGESERAVWRAMDALSDAGLTERLAPPAARSPMMRRDFVRAAAIAGGSLALMAAGPIAAATKSAEEKSKMQVKTQEQANKKSETAREQSSKTSLSAKEEAQKKTQKDMAAKEQARKSQAASSGSDAKATEQKNKMASHAQESRQK